MGCTSVNIAVKSLKLEPRILKLEILKVVDAKKEVKYMDYIIINFIRLGMI